MTKKLYTPFLIASAALAFASCDKKPETPKENGYYFTVVSHDEYGNESELSNEVHASNVATAEGAVTMGSRTFAPNSRGYINTPNPTYARNKAMFQSTDGAIAGVVNVKFRPSMRANIAKAALGRVATGAARVASSTGLDNVDRAAAMLGAGVSFKRIFPYVAKHEARAQRHELDLWYEVRFDGSAVPVARAISAFDNMGEIERVETLHATVINDGSEGVEPIIARADGLMDYTTRAAQMPFNDPLLGRQWHYDRNVQDKVVAEAGHISLLRAWKKTAGSNNVIVAVIDQGIDVTHEDLKDAMWENKGEIAGNKIDDDKNGFVDDINGWNFCNGSGSLGMVGRTHGCHVGGTVGATNNNGKGVCGIAGGTGKGDGVRLMSCDVHSFEGPGGNREAEAFYYATNNGAIIAQCSWGFSSPNISDGPQKAAIDYFIAEAGNAEDFPDSPMRGGIAIFASGNSRSTSDKYYPAAYDNVVAVTATTIRGDRPGYANVGAWVDIAAPGGADTEADPSGALVVSCLRENQYGGMPGTSMATPHVSGVAALLVGANPGITPDKLREMLMSSGKSTNESAPEYVGLMGVGCINASKYLSLDTKDAPGKITNLEFKFKSGYKLDWTVPADPSFDDITGYTLYYDIKPIQSANMATAKQMKVDTLMTPGEVYSLDVNKIPGIKIKN